MICFAFFKNCVTVWLVSVLETWCCVWSKNWIFKCSFDSVHQDKLGISFCMAFFHLPECKHQWHVVLCKSCVAFKLVICYAPMNSVWEISLFMLYVMILSVAQTSVKWWDDLWVVNWKGCGSGQTDLMSYSVIFTEGLRKTMENLRLVFKPWCLIYVEEEC